MTTIAYITNNIAPFRVALLDELATHAEVTLYYVTEIDAGVNPQYVSQRPQKAHLASIPQQGIRQTLRQLQQADAVIFDGYAGRTKWALLIGCLLTKTPYAISVDGLRPKKEKGFKRWMKQLALRHATQIFSTSLPTDHLLQQLAPQTPIRRHTFTTLYARDVISGMDKRQQAIATDNFQKEAPLLFVGKFLQTKGVREWIEATLPIHRPKIMVGGTLEELAALDVTLDDTYTVIPFLERKDVYTLMQQTSVFVLPTYTDSWGLVIVEALSNGVPVVTTTACNAGVALVHEGKNGYLVEKESASQLQHAIEQALALSPTSVLDFNRQQMSDYTVEAAAFRMYEAVREEE